MSEQYQMKWALGNLDMAYRLAVAAHAVQGGHQGICLLVPCVEIPEGGQFIAIFPRVEVRWRFLAVLVNSLFITVRESNHGFDGGCRLVSMVVVPAKAGTWEKNLDSRFRGNDGLKDTIRQDF